MNEKIKQLLKQYADGLIEYPSLFSQLDGLLANGEIDQESYDILMGIL